MKNIFKKEKFSIRKFTVGAVSVVVGASLAIGAPIQNQNLVKAVENIKAETANEEVSLSVIEKDGSVFVEITATKDITNADVKVTLDTTVVKTFHIDNLKAGEKIIKELTKAEIDVVKKQMQKGLKSLPNTAVVRKSIEKSLSIAEGTLKVVLSYDVEESSDSLSKPENPGNNVVPNKPTAETHATGEVNVQPALPEGTPHEHGEVNTEPSLPEGKVPTEQKGDFETGEANVQPALPEGNPHEHGEANVQPALPEGNPHEHGEANVQPALPEGNPHEHGEANVQPALPEGTPHEHGEANVQPALPEGTPHEHGEANTEPSLPEGHPEAEKPAEDKELSTLKVKAKEKVAYSEKIAPVNKEPYMKKIDEAKTISEVNAIINEVEALNNDVAPEKPAVEKSEDELKAELEKLVAEKIDKNSAEFKNSSIELQSNYKKAYAKAQLLLANGASKEELAKQIETLKKVTEDIKNNKTPEVTPVQPEKPTEQPEKPQPTEDKALKDKKSEAKKAVLASEKIAPENKNAYIKRINEATTIEALNAIISEVSSLEVAEKPTKPEQPTEAKPSAEKDARKELEKLAARELRTEAGYVANAGNQTANNDWIAAKTKAEEVLKNSKSTDLEIEEALTNLKAKIYNALLGSEKTKVEKALEKSSLADQEKMLTKVSIRKAKTFEELEEVAKKIGTTVKNTTESENNNSTKPTKPKDESTEPTKPLEPGSNGANEPATPEKPTKENNLTITEVKEGIKSADKIKGNGGLIVVDVFGKNLDATKLGLNIYVDGKKVDNISVEKFPGETAEKVSYTLTIPQNIENKEVTYKFVATVDGKESTVFLEKVQEAFVAEAKIENYEEKNSTLAATGGEASLVLKGKDLDVKNVSIRVFDADQIEENTSLTAKVTYEKQGEDVVAKLILPENTSTGAKSYKLKIYANDKEVNITTLKDRDRRDKPVFTVVGKNEDVKKPILSNATITSYKTSGTGAVSDGVEKTETTVASNQVSKKTEVHLFGANLDEAKTKVKIVDQNGVEWPIEGAESDLIKMVLKNSKGGMKGIQGNGTFQIAEIILPSNLSENMTFTYYFAVDGVNFDTTHPLRAIVEKTDGQVEPTVKEVTFKYQTEDGAKIADDKVGKVYAHFPVSAGKVDIAGHTFDKVKDFESLTSHFGDKMEVVYVYKKGVEKPQPETPVTPGETPNKPAEPETPTKPSENNEVAELKAQLQKLVDRDLTKEENYKMADSSQEKAWKTSRANAQKTLAKADVDKNELELRITKLEKAIKTLADANVEKNKETSETTQPTEKPSEEKPNANQPVTPEKPTPNQPSEEKPKDELANKKLEAKKAQAKSVVNYSERIMDKTSYLTKIEEAKTVEEVEKIITEVNNINEGKVNTTTQPEVNTEKTVEEIKAELQKLVDRKLKEEDVYKNSSPDLQKTWRQVRAKAQQLLNDNSATKEDLANQLKALEKATKDIENYK